VLKERENNFIVRGAAALTLALAFATNAFAGDVEDVLRQLPLKGVQADDAEQKKDAPLPAGASRATPSITAPAVEPFVLKSVTIEGATVFAEGAFRAAYSDQLMKTVGASELARIAEDITKIYRAHGYFLSRAIIPAQDVAQGHLRIRIVEGYIAAVEIDGDVPELAAYADTLVSERPAQLTTLERTLYLMGDAPGVRFKASRMAPDGDDIARHKLIVTAERVRYELSFYSDNRGKPNAGELQAIARAGVAHVIGFGDRLSGGFFFVPDQPEELELGLLNYTTALGHDGAVLTLDGSVSRNDLGDSGPGLDNLSESTRFFGQVSYPLVRGRETSLWLHGGFETLHIRQEVSGALSYQDDIVVAHVAATLRQTIWDGLATVYLEVADGFVKAPDVAHSRADADGRFTKLFAQATYVHPIGPLSVFAEVDGQVSDQALLSANEFALGGSRIGRGYDTGEISGEEGVGGVVELRYYDKITEWLAAQVYGFYDAGIVWNDNAPPGLDDMTLSSAGAGVRLSLPYAVYVSYEAAKPLTRTPAVTGDKDVRHFFSLSWSL